MEYLCFRNIVFCNLKPDSVGFNHKWDMKLCDLAFGIGIHKTNEGNPICFLFDRCDTPQYMAPGVELSLGYRMKTGVYSIDVLL